MENFTYSWPTKIIFGKTTENEVGEHVGGKCLLHYGTGSIKKTGLYDKIVASLKKSNIDFVELGGVVPNPKIELVREGIELCKKENVGFILAVGGGSVIDSAKAIAAGVYYDGDPWDFFEKQLPVEKALPIGVVTGQRPPTDDVLMKLPAPFAIIKGKTTLIRRKTLLRFTPITRSQSSTGFSCIRTR